VLEFSVTRGRGPQMMSTFPAAELARLTRDPVDASGGKLRLLLQSRLRFGPAVNSDATPHFLQSRRSTPPDAKMLSRHDPPESNRAAIYTVGPQPPAPSNVERCMIRKVSDPHVWRCASWGRVKLGPAKRAGQ
jgi:hypothetical protein